MSERWPEVSLGEIATPVTRKVPVVPGQSYRTIGVKWWGEGAYERETIDGSRTAAKTLSLVREGDLIINKIWVRHGSTAIASRDVDGCAASGEFPTFELNLERVLPAWIHWQTKTRAFWTKCDALSRGTSGKNRIKPELFLTVRVLLPSLGDQQGAIARLNALSAHIHEASSLREQAAVEADELWRFSVRQVLLDCESQQVPLHSVCSVIIDNLHTTPHYADTGVPCVRSPDVGWGTLNLRTALKTDEAEYTRRTSRGAPQANDIVLVREGGGTGKAAMVMAGQRFSLGQRVMMLRPNTAMVLPQFFLYQLLSPLIQDDYIAPLSKGSASPHLNISSLKRFPFRLPSLVDQARIVAELDQLDVAVRALKALQHDTASELDALLPSVLANIFRR